MDKSKRRRRRENEELRLLVFVLSYSNYELGFTVYGWWIALSKAFQCSSVMLPGVNNATPAAPLSMEPLTASSISDGISPWPSGSLIFALFCQSSQMNTTAINRTSCLARRLLPLSRSEPARSVLQIEIVIIHREESVDIPFIPFLTNHPFSVRVRPREYGGAHFLAFAVNLVGDGDLPIS